MHADGPFNLAMDKIGEIHCGHWLWSALLGCLQNFQPLAISAPGEGNSGQKRARVEACN